MLAESRNAMRGSSDPDRARRDRGDRAAAARLGSSRLDDARLW
jgi:hypothetical protein